MWAAHLFYWSAFPGPNWASYIGPIHKLATGIIMDPRRLLMYYLHWIHLGFLYGAPLMNLTVGTLDPCASV